MLTALQSTTQAPSNTRGSPTMQVSQKVLERAAGGQAQACKPVSSKRAQRFVARAAAQQPQQAQQQLQQQAQASTAEASFQASGRSSGKKTGARALYDIASSTTTTAPASNPVGDFASSPAALGVAGVAAGALLAKLLQGQPAPVVLSTPGPAGPAGPAGPVRTVERTVEVTRSMDESDVPEGSLEDRQTAIRQHFPKVGEAAPGLGWCPAGGGGGDVNGGPLGMGERGCKARLRPACRHVRSRTRARCCVPTPQALPIDDYMSRLEIALSGFGFTGACVRVRACARACERTSNLQRPASSGLVQRPRPASQMCCTADAMPCASQLPAMLTCCHGAVPAAPPRL